MDLKLGIAKIAMTIHISAVQNSSKCLNDASNLAKMLLVKTRNFRKKINIYFKVTEDKFLNNLVLNAFDLAKFLLTRILGMQIDI